MLERIGVMNILKKYSLVVILVISLLLFSACSNNQVIEIQVDVYNYIKSENLDKCGIDVLYDYDKKNTIKEIIEKTEYNIDKNQVVDYSKKIVKNYESIAYMYDLTLEEYYTEEMGISKSEFFEKCYGEGVYDTKYFLTIGAIAAKEELAISNDEYEQYINDNDLSDDLSEKEQNKVRFLILESKIRELLKENTKDERD